jgi:hypothetical protein
MLVRTCNVLQTNEAIASGLYMRHRSPMRTKPSLKAVTKATTSRTLDRPARFLRGRIERALLVCSRALGASMVANKLPGVMAAL